MNDPKETIFIPLSPDVTARVEIQIITEGLPSPGEIPTLSAPTARQLDHAATLFALRKYTFSTKP